MNVMQCRRTSYVPSRCAAARARRRISDYSARRAGGDEENARRSRTSREFNVPSDQRGYQNGTGRQRSEDHSSWQNSSGYDNYAVQPSPAVVRRNSVDYSSRRSGGQEENQRRSQDFSGRTSRQPRYDERGMAPPSPARVPSAASSPRTASSSPRVTPRRAASPSTPHWNPPSPSRDSFDAIAQHRDASPPLARKRSVDYASRRSGNQEENLRRSGDFDSPRSTASGPARSNMGESFSSTPQAQQYSPRGTAPPVMRKRSTDYSSRRSGGQEENQRRSGDYRSPIQTPRRQSPSSYAPDSPLSTQSAASSYSPRASQPRIERKRSTDYSSRRAGGQEENQRRSRDYAPPTSSRGSTQPATRYDYTPPRTRGSQEDPRPRGVASQDFVPIGEGSDRDGRYGSPRSGSSSTNYSPRGNGVVGMLDENSPPTRAGRANAERRRSGNYNERRSSGVSEENSRRRSVDMITGAIREPSREGPPAGRRMVGGYDDKESAASAYSASKKVVGVPRESKDFLPAANIDPWVERLTPQQPRSTPQMPLKDGPKEPAETDWPRVIAGNLPAAFLVFAGIAAIDVSTGFDITRLAVRYGGPGAPPSAIVAFWPTAIAAAGVLSTLLTSVLKLEAFGLKAKCPNCGTVNRAGFKGVLGGSDAEISRVECENCMADLRFDLPNKFVVVERGSEEKKQEALERGRQQALRIARMQAEEAQREAQQYMDKEPRDF